MSGASSSREHQPSAHNQTLSVIHGKNGWHGRGEGAPSTWGSVMANQYRGKGSSAYQRQQQALKKLCKAKGIGCSNCGKPFDFDDHNSKRGFTADHPEAIANGGRLLGQKLVPLCRECNGRKGKTVDPILRPAT